MPLTTTLRRSARPLLPPASLALALGLALLPARPALAASCDLSSASGFDFGTVTQGQATSTSARVAFSCSGDPGQTLYFRVCLAPSGQPPFQMASQTGSSYQLNYALYSTELPDQPLQATPGQHWAQATVASSGEQAATGAFSLLAKIPAGQSSLPSGGYLDNRPLRLSYASASSIGQLPECSPAMPQTNTVAAVQARIASTCQIQSVSPMNFGTLSAASGAARLAADATARLSIQCPVGQAFSLGLDGGLHAGRNTASTPRSLCGPNGDCVGYDLYQDAGGTRQWGSQRGLNTLDVPASSGTAMHYDIHGRIPPQPWPTPGTYLDTVTITLTY